MKEKTSKKKFTAYILAITMLLSLLLPSSAAFALDNTNNETNSLNSKKSSDTIDIISINDFHGALKEENKNVGAAKLVGEIKKQKEQNPNTIVVSGGDLFQGSAMSNQLKGEPVIKMLKEMGLVYSAIGNHEFDWGKEIIPKWGKDGNFEFIAANIYNKATNKPVDWANPYGLAKINGKTIAFIGLATPETVSKTKPANVADLDFKDPVEITNYWAKYLREKKGADAVFVLSHIGSLQDFKTSKITGEVVDLANKTVGIDGIISGHTHRFVCGTINNLPIVQGGCNGRGYAKLSLSFKDGKVKVNPSIEMLYKKGKDLVEDKNMKAIYDNYNKNLQSNLEKVVCNIDCELTHSRNSLSPLGQFASKYMAESAGVPIGITNGGGLRRPLPAGNITVGNMWELMPFDNTLVTMKLTGSQLKKVLENGILNDSVGCVQFYGLRVYYDKTKDLGNRITSMRLLNGTKVEMDKEYPVVTNDFMYAKGDDYDFSGAKDATDTGIPIREALIQKLGTIRNVPFKFDDKTLVDGKDPAINTNMIPNTEDMQVPNNNESTNVIPLPSNKNDNAIENKENAIKSNNSDELPTVNSQEKAVLSNTHNLPRTGFVLGSDGLLYLGAISTIGGLAVFKKKKHVA
ncbi:5'-nucleotidase C-terminal domain-containing protein [Clostridium tarantellae]|nr:5'-nucleotidase C-terminal domain-containing protein [Clostridium tarantellae]